MPITMSYLAVFFIVSFLIFIHELGHFLVAMIVGIPISRFSVGMGRSLLAWQRGRTEYRISAIPLGGYVLPDVRDAGMSFLEIPVAKRIAFALGGPAANILVAGLMFAVINVAVGGLPIHSAIIDGFTRTFIATGEVLRALPQLFSAPGHMSGLIGVVAQGGDFIAGSITLALQFAIVMSINLAILNLIPIPPLDGGKVLLYLLECIHGSARRLQIPLNVAGVVLLLGVIGYTAISDVTRLIMSFFV